LRNRHLDTGTHAYQPHFIQLSPSVLEVLAVTLQRRAEYAKSERWEKDCGLVFTTSVGRPVEYRNVITHFKKVISQTGLPNIRFHDLRHTVATLLLSKEINPKIVQEQLGHSSINLTLNTYSHVIKSMRGIAANALEEVVGSD
jgi:integrase